MTFLAVISLVVACGIWGVVTEHLRAPFWVQAAGAVVLYALFVATGGAP